MKIEMLTNLYAYALGRKALQGEVLDVDDEVGQSLVDGGQAQPAREVQPTRGGTPSSGGVEFEGRAAK